MTVQYIYICIFFSVIYEQVPILYVYNLDRKCLFLYKWQKMLCIQFIGAFYSKWTPVFIKTNWVKKIIWLDVRGRSPCVSLCVKKCNPSQNLTEHPPMSKLSEYRTLLILQNNTSIIIYTIIHPLFIYHICLTFLYSTPNSTDH